MVWRSDLLSGPDSRSRLADDAQMVVRLLAGVCASPGPRLWMRDTSHRTQPVVDEIRRQSWDEVTEHAVCRSVWCEPSTAIQLLLDKYGASNKAVLREAWPPSAFSNDRARMQKRAISTASLIHFYCQDQTATQPGETLTKWIDLDSGRCRGCCRCPADR